MTTYSVFAVLHSYIRIDDGPFSADPAFDKDVSFEVTCTGRGKEIGYAIMEFLQTVYPEIGIEKKVTERKRKILRIGSVSHTGI